MFRSKKDVDAHVRDVFSKCDSESDRLKLCFGIARQYTGIKEFDTARRYLETYVASNPTNIAEAQKLMGDIQLELGEDVKALESYKASYASGKGRDSLNRVCDLLIRGVGTLETPETKKWWLDLQKSPANGNSFMPTSSSPAMPKRTQTSAGPPKTGFSHTTFNNGSSSPLISASKTNGGGNVDLQLRYLERRFDDGLGKILDQNTMVLEQMLRFKDDVKNLSDKMEQVAETQQKMQADIKELQDKEISGLLTTEFNQLNSLSSGKCLCEDRSKELKVALTTLSSNAKTEYAGLKDQIDRLERLTLTAIDNFNKEAELRNSQANTVTIPPIVNTGPMIQPQNNLPTSNMPMWTLPVANPNPKPLSELLKKPEGSWECGNCYVSNLQERSKCVACDAIRPDSERVTKTELPIVQPDFNFGFSTAKPVANPTLNFGFNTAINATPVAAVNNSGISATDGKSTTTNVINTPIKSEENKGSPFVGLNLAGKFSFSDLAQNSNNSSFTFGGGSTETFAGAGAPLFSGLNLSTKVITQEQKTPKEQSIANTSTNAEDGEDDFVPTVEFEPVIPLPPLVEVKKGDENENTIAEYRAKLYRFVSETKEWKERGVGNIKLLQAKDDPKKCRVVMWREKIGKLACNFSLFPDIKVTNYQNNLKVLCWKCQDFAEGTAWETFTLRFSNEDNCTHFKNEMERLAKLTSTTTTDSPKTKIEDSSNVSSLTVGTNGPTVNSGTSTNSSEVPLSQLFKKPEGSWECGNCYVSNTPERSKCVACDAFRPGCESISKTEPALPIVQPQFSFGFPAAMPVANPTLNFGFNTAINATPVAVNNSGISTTDGKSSTTNDASTPLKSDENKGSPFVGLNLAGKFSFSDLAQNSNNSSFKFGGGTETFAGAGAPLFSGLKLTTQGLTQEQKTPKEQSIANTSTNAEDGEDDFVPTVEFEPVIPLPPLVEVKKGDENENTIAEYRAKLYRFVSETKEWKERGVGNIKLLQAKDDPNKCRVVMWREKIGKLACNFSLFPDIKVTNYQGNSKVLCWKCQDFAEGTAWETFTLRFSNEDNCTHFKNEMERLAKLTSTTTTDSPKTKIEDSPNVSSLTVGTNGPTVNFGSSTNSSEVPLSQLFKKPEGSWECGHCYVSNTPERSKCVACDAIRPGCESTSKTEPALPIVQPQFSFGFPAAMPVANPTLNFGFNTANNNTTSVALNNSGSSASDGISSTTNDASTPIKSDEIKGSPFVGLNLAGKFSFSDIAQNNNSNFTFGGGSSHTPSFAGAGAPLFSGLNLTPKLTTPKEQTITNTSTNAEDGEDDFVPTVEFEPVIPLPPLVEVKKGDENENTIAEYRAKLYRFVSETKEWKERGVGNIKLLQAKDDPNKCRVVMWREKIGKLACNFSLFPDIKITNYQNNPKVLCWKCQDFAEGTAWETFTLRFSNEKNCEDFKNKLMEYANNAPSASNVSSTEAETSSSCPGCRGCDADSYQFPEHKYVGEEAVIDIPLDADASTIPPFNVPLGYFDQSDNASPDKNQTPSIGQSEVRDVADESSNKGLSSFSFSLQSPDKTPNPISFQFKSPNFSFKPADSPSIFGSPGVGGVSIFSPLQGTPAFSSNTPSPFVSPFAQSPGENKDSSPQLDSSFSFPPSVFQTDPVDESHGQEEDEYEDVDDEDECMFEDDAHIYIQNDADSSEDFSDKGEGVVRVLYDGESYCARLVILVEEENIAEHLVAVETILEPKDEKTYEWIGVCNPESPIKSKIRVTFSNDEAFKNFSIVMADGLEFAQQVGITEGVLLEGY